MAIGSISYRLFVKVSGTVPAFLDGHFNSRGEAINHARDLIEADPGVDFINVYCQEHVKRFSRTRIVEEG